MTQAQSGRRVRCLIAVAAVVYAPLGSSHAAQAQSIWDKLKSKARNEIEKAIEDKVKGGETKDTEDMPAPTDTPAGPGNAMLAPGAPPSDGLWQGQLVPAGKKSIISYGNVTITLADTVKLLRYQSNADCHAELDGVGGTYEAHFISGQGTCGTRAAIRLGADGAFRLTWEDAPAGKSGERTYQGNLTRSVAAFPRKAWSVKAARRDAFDILGFRLGMRYGDALDRIRADDEMSHEWRLISSANGRGTLSPVEIVTKGSGKGMAFVGETISLQFEAQAPAEMRVKQDPDVIARRAEIDAIAEKRAQEEQRIHADYARTVRTLTRKERDKRRAAAEEMQRRLAALPPVPEKPALRPEGADAELLVIARQITFPRNARPHIDNVTAALIAKYGPPSVRLGDGRALEWAFDSKGKPIENAAGGACDIISPAAKQDHEGEIAYYAHMPGFISPACGLTLAVELRPEGDGGLYQMRVTSFDQQRLLGDNWYRTVRLAEATMEKIRADLDATKSVKAPKL